MTDQQINSSVASSLCKKDVLMKMQGVMNYAKNLLEFRNTLSIIIPLKCNLEKKVWIQESILVNTHDLKNITVYYIVPIKKKIIIFQYLANILQFIRFKKTVSWSLTTLGTSQTESAMHQLRTIFLHFIHLSNIKQKFCFLNK